ncbi:MAG: hypothetical protein ACREUT_15495 [Steroidobacteraceae bacterium]
MTALPEGAVPLEPERIEPLYVLTLSLCDLEALREAVMIARILAPERRLSAEQLIEKDRRSADFHVRAAQYWADEARQAERAQRVLDRTQIAKDQPR